MSKIQKFEGVPPHPFRCPKFSSTGPAGRGKGEGKKSRISTRDSHPSRPPAKPPIVIQAKILIFIE